MRILLIIGLVLTLLSPVNGEPIVEPPIDKIKQWKLDHYLGVLVEYELQDGTVIQFAHPILSVQKANECNQFRKESNELIILMNEEGIPIRYITSGQPTMYKFNIGQWVPIIAKTFHE